MATFGKLTDGAAASTGSVDQKFVSAATPTTSGVVTKATIRVWVSSGSTTAKAVIYGDTAGAPGALLATGDEVTISNTTEQAIDFSFSGAQQISVVANTQYWIGAIIKDPGAPTYSLSRDSSLNLLKANADTYSDGPSDPFGTPTNINGPVDCFVTYKEWLSPNTFVMQAVNRASTY
jgi:hypothetical protein